jgi:mono/diheme cytochrome c family protein
MTAALDHKFRWAKGLSRMSWFVAFAAAGTAVLALGVLTSAQDQPAAAKAKESAFASAADSKKAFDRVVAPFFAKHCVGCHNAQRSEGELDLAALDPDMKASPSGARWAMLAEKLTTGEMPPEGRARPGEENIRSVVDWVKAEMKRAGKHFARREAYANGNQVNHDKLFDPTFVAKFDSPAGVRRLSPEIYAALLKEVRSPEGVGQPFTPEGRTTFKDMGAPKLDEPTTAQLIRNAIQIVTARTNFKVEGGKLKGAGSVPGEFIKLMDESSPLTDANIAAAFNVQFKAVLARQPTREELARFSTLLHKNVKDAGRVTGARYALAAVFLLPEAVYRWELGSGPADGQGRVRLAPREIAFALARTLTDRQPDATLLAAAEKGRLDTKEGVAAALQRLLDDPKLQKPRILRFFREYFGYEKAKDVFQEDKENPDHDARVLVEDTDRLIEYLLEKDQNVLREMLTTNKSFVAYKSAAETKKRRATELAKFEAAKAKEPQKYKDKKAPKVGRSIYLAYNLTDFPDTQPVELPAEQRAGILTQPAWLAANAKTGENHAIFRGKWVRERLLGGVVPDIPITVDAQLPEAPQHTLRERMKVTQQAYCYKCHTFMNPVGLPFEIYDHLGRFRKTEPVLDKDATAKNVDKRGKLLGPVQREVAVDASGAINHFNDPAVAGDVTDAVQMLKKLAASERVEQVFVRHAFRFFLGRNETLGDGPSLRQAHQAYRESGGSMKALITALLTSDSFLYRVRSLEGKGMP